MSKAMSQAQRESMTRRTLIAGASAAGAAALPFPAGGATAELAQIAARLREADRKLCEANAHEHEKCTTFHDRMPERPNALRWNMLDPVGYEIENLDNGKCIAWCSTCDIEKRRHAPVMKRDFIGTDEQWQTCASDPALWAQVPDESRQKRLDEIVAAHGAYQSQVAALSAEVGLDAAAAASSQAAERLQSVLDQFVGTATTTLDELRLKARTMLELDEWKHSDLDTEDEPEVASPRRIVASILRDLIG